MRFLRGIAWWALTCVVIVVLPVAAQPDSSAGVASTRVAILPFVNYAEDPAALPVVMNLVRAELSRRSAELVTADAVAEVLRDYRIRNTNELSIEQLSKISVDLAAGYVLVGSLDRFVESDAGAEVALTARLISVPSMSVEWMATSATHTDDGIRPLGLGTAQTASHIARHSVKDLFKSFRYERDQDVRLIQAVRLQEGKSAFSVPCHTILVLPFSNESDVHFAGNIISQRILSTLFREGFTFVDPGTVREAMLHEGDLTPGKATDSLLAIFRERTGADLVLTGTVSQLDVGTQVSLDIVPGAAVEARLIDARSGEVVWAKTFSSSGNDGALFFGTGTMHGAAAVMDHLASRLVNSIPVRKARKV